MESVSLGWREPVRVVGLRLRESDSHTVLSIAEYTTSAHLWSLVAGRSGLGIPFSFMLNIALSTNLFSPCLIVSTHVPLSTIMKRWIWLFPDVYGYVYRGCTSVTTDN